MIFDYKICICRTGKERKKIINKMQIYLYSNSWFHISEECWFCIARFKAIFEKCILGAHMSLSHTMWSICFIDNFIDWFLLRQIFNQNYQFSFIKLMYRTLHIKNNSNRLIDKLILNDNHYIGKTFLMSGYPILQTQY